MYNKPGDEIIGLGKKNENVREKNLVKENRAKKGFKEFET